MTAEIRQLPDLADVEQFPGLEARRLDWVGEQFDDQALAENTRDAYRRFFDAFDAWCGDHRHDSLPASEETVLRYVAHLGERARAGEIVAATIGRHLSAIRWKHREEGVTKVDNPATADAVRKRLQGIKRDDNVRTASRPKRGIKRNRLLSMVRALPEGMRGELTRAVLLVGYFGAFRRSELVALDLEHVEWCEDGAIINLPKSKTDQTGEKAQQAWLPRVGGDLCPVRALRSWIDAAEVDAGAIFRSMDRWGNVKDGRMSGRAVARAVKRAAEAAGFDSEEFSGHSLRRGAAMQASENGASLPELKMMGRWESDRMPMHYAAPEDLKRRSASNKLA